MPDKEPQKKKPDKEPNKEAASDQVAAKQVKGKSGKQIHVIPDQFYGAALKTKLQTKDKESTPEGVAPPKKSFPFVPIIIGIILLAAIGVGGYFAYMYRDAILGAPPAPEPIAEAEPEPEPEPEPPPPPPSAPANLAATSTNPRSVTVSWEDTSDNEAAFRVERRPETQTIFSRVSDLPPNSTTFQDNSVQASTTYMYRVIARNNQGESPGSNEAMVTTPPLPPEPEKVEPLPPAGLDTDSDGLSDLEESLFGADPRSPDTEGDGFLDGNEVFNLYNPNGRAPAKLTESGLMKEFSGEIGWKILIPKEWEGALEAPDGSSATVSSDHGETFTITIENNANNQEIIEWYLARNPDVNRSDVLFYRSKGGYEGIIGADLLTTYLPWNGKIFIFKYQMNDQPFINFRTAYSMMLNSLELTGLSGEVIPAGTGQLPFEPAATKQGEMTQPMSIDEATSSEATEDLFPNPEQPATSTQ